jgi:hypothetical protein
MVTSFLFHRRAQLFQQGGKIIAIGRLAGDQPPRAVDRILPVEVDAIETIFFNNRLRGLNKHRPGFFRRRRAGESARPPAADGKQDFQVGFCWRKLGIFCKSACTFGDSQI